MVRTWEYMGAGDAVQAGADVLLATYGYPMGRGLMRRC